MDGITILRAGVEIDEQPGEAEEKHGDSHGSKTDFPGERAERQQFKNPQNNQQERGQQKQQHHPEIGDHHTDHHIDKVADDAFRAGKQ